MNLFRRKPVMSGDPGIRTFASGANRDTDQDKYEYAGYLSPLVLQRFGAYMTKNRHLADGTLRASDNWQKGIPKAVYEQSLWRHVIDWWSLHRGWKGVATQDIEEALCGVMFNAMGFLHEVLKEVLKEGVQLHDCDQNTSYEASLSLGLLSGESPNQDLPSAPIWAGVEPEAVPDMSATPVSRSPTPWTCPDPAHHELHGPECPAYNHPPIRLVGDEAPRDEPDTSPRPDEGAAAGYDPVPEPEMVEPAWGCWCDMAPKPHEAHLMKANWDQPEDLGEHLYVFTQAGLTAWVPV